YRGPTRLRDRRRLVARRGAAPHPRLCDRVPASRGPGDRGGSSVVLRPWLAEPDSNDRPSIMTSGVSGLGTGVERNRRVDVLVPQELAHDLVLARVLVEVDFPGGVPEPVRWHIEPRVGEDQLPYLGAERPFSFGPLRAITGKQKPYGLTGAQDRPPQLEVQLKEINGLGQQREFKVVRVLYLMRRETQVNAALPSAADLDEMAVYLDRGYPHRCI